MIDDEELLNEFLVESFENLDRLDQDFIDLEQEPTSREILASIFRTVHTIKGTSGFLGFDKLEAVTHVGENLLGKLRDGELRVNGEITSTLLRMVDAVREIMASIEVAHSEGDGDYTALIGALTRVQQTDAMVAAMQAVSDVAHELPGVAGDPIRRSGLSESDNVGAFEAATGSAKSIAESSVRVDVALLDSLIDLVGELVLARNQLVQLTGSRSGGKGDATTAASQRVSLITSELQERVMKTRMQPINTVWGKLPRVVRDLAVACGKKVRVELDGQDTELDKTIIEAIKDPLTHLVRNSVDHGIEEPSVREAAGKSPEGKLCLRAYHEGGKVVIEILDDGAGIDPAKIRAKVVEKGLLTAEHAEQLSDHDAMAYIFTAGFSTASQVTNVSGRGVGMDVVKNNIEKIGGSLDVQSKIGHGTTLTIRIPLTLAIVPALIVVTCGARFAVPQPNLVELVRLKDEAALEEIDGASFHRLRGRLLPVLDLAELLNIERPADDCGPAAGAARTLAVLQIDGAQFGLLVDRVNDAEEIVVKPLGRHLKSVDVFAGCTIMGDGTVALILDVMSIARRCRVSSASAADPDAVAARVETESLLLCHVGGARVAIPLDKVARLEHVELDRLELAGTQEVVKYADTLLPVVRLANFIGSEGTSAGRLKLVVTNEDSGSSVGLLVDDIFDAIEVAVGSVSMQGGANRFCVLGTAVVAGEVTEVLDVEGVTATVDPSFFTHTLLSV